MLISNVVQHTSRRCRHKLSSNHLSNNDATNLPMETSVSLLATLPPKVEEISSPDIDIYNSFGTRDSIKDTCHTVRRNYSSLMAHSISIGIRNGLRNRCVSFDRQKRRSHRTRERTIISFVTSGHQSGGLTLMQSVSALTLVSEDIDRSRSDASIFDVAVATRDRSSHACSLPFPAYFFLSFFQFPPLCRSLSLFFWVTL